MRVERIKSALQADTGPLGFQCINAKKPLGLRPAALKNLDLYVSYIAPSSNPAKAAAPSR